MHKIAPTFLKPRDNGQNITDERPPISSVFLLTRTTLFVYIESVLKLNIIIGGDEECVELDI